MTPRALSPYGISLFLFVFPLLCPAVGGTVIYPFALYGIYILWHKRLNRNALYLVLMVAVVSAAYALVDLAAVMRIIAFISGCIFVLHTLEDDARTRLMLRFARWHAWVIGLQMLVVVLGYRLDFSEVLRLVYGDFLPRTGTHVDYNAFSQLDLFLPRVAGLNREPAFASILFLGLTYIALKRRDWRTAVLLAAAVLCTLSKIVFPLIAGLMLLYFSPSPRARMSVQAVLGRAALFVVLNICVILGVKANIELVEGAMLLDASFYHRFIGLHAMAEQPEQFALVGNSQAKIGAAPIFEAYEFRNDQRAFLDGNALSKVLVDLGYIAAGIYVIALAALARDWHAILAITMAGVFINFMSTAPATALLFVLLWGRWRSRTAIVVPAPTGLDRSHAEELAHE